MAAVRGESAEGEVIHLRLPPELKDALKDLANVEGRPITGQVIHMLDEALFGPRELRLVRGQLRRN